MKKKNKIVVALGGNALGKTPEEQLEKVKIAAKSLVDLIVEDNEIIIAHGNGPQVGMINLAFEESSKVNDKIAKFELPECTSMSQGYIGFHLQNAINRELKSRSLFHQVITVITQIEVDEDDPAFKNPTKPIGSFYTKKEAEKLSEKDPTLVIKEDAGRGYRRMVASPKPIKIIEQEAICSLVDKEFIVIACGGGGIPVIKNEDGGYSGIASVIDKDFASSKLAETIDADYLFILTAVDRVTINFNTDEEKEIKKMNVEEAQQYIKEGHFAAGSMLPKVEASLEFVKGYPKRKAVIASLDKAKLVLEGKSGTLIYDK